MLTLVATDCYTQRMTFRANDAHTDRIPDPSTEFTKATVTELNTPTLVRHFRDLHVLGSHQRLTDDQASQMSAVVDELRRRGVLD